MEPARPVAVPLLGTDGPVAVITGRVAYRLARPLLRELERAQAHGEYVEPAVVGAIRAIELAGLAYVDRVKGAAHAAAQAANDLMLDEHLLSTAEVAAQLGCSPRNVRALAERGAIPAVRNGRAWGFDPVDVAELVAARAS